MLRYRPWATIDAFQRDQEAQLDREWSNFVEDDGGARQRFLELALSTYAELREAYYTELRGWLLDTGKLRTFEVPLIRSSFLSWPGAGGFPLNRQRFEQHASPTRVAAWADWRDDYRSFETRNPRLALANELRRIGDSHKSRIWWPRGLEEKLQDWVDNSPVSEPPFRDRHGIATPAFRHRLQILRRQIDGWVWRDPKLNVALYLPETEWQATRMRLAEERAAFEARAKAAREEFARQRRARDRAVQVARSNRPLWHQLLELERRLEAAALARPPRARQKPAVIPPRLPNPMTRAEREAASFDRFDPELRLFTAGVARYVPELSLYEVAMTLRRALRRELRIHRGGWGVETA